MTKQTCIVPGDNHSSDIFALHYGVDAPVFVCGFHDMKHRGTQYIFNLARKK